MDKSSATLCNSSFDFPFLPLPLPTIGVPPRFVPLLEPVRVGSTEDIGLDSPRKNVTSMNWRGLLELLSTIVTRPPLEVDCFLRRLYRSLGGLMEWGGGGRVT